jgi:hypothetical protein
MLSLKLRHMRQVFVEFHDNFCSSWKYLYSVAAAAVFSVDGTARLTSAPERALFSVISTFKHLTACSTVSVARNVRMC